jgi:hypothetical protein
MSDDHRRFLIVEQGVGAAIFNLLFNAFIAWALFRRLDVVPLWGDRSVAGDTIATGVLLPLLTCLIVTRLVRRHVAAGGVPPLADRPPAVAWMPHSSFLRGVTLAVLTSVTLVPVTIATLSALGVAAMGFWTFVAFKGAWAALAALVVTPVVALWALAAPATASTRGAT